MRDESYGLAIITKVHMPGFVPPSRIWPPPRAEPGLAEMTGARTMDYKAVLPYNGNWTPISEPLCERGEIPQGFRSESLVRRSLAVRMQRSGPGEVGLLLSQPEGPGPGQIGRRRSASYFGERPNGIRFLLSPWLIFNKAIFYFLNVILLRSPRMG